MHGLDMYDYSARFYEPAAGRFTTVDPHAENYYSWSPYAYCANNPIRIIDPNGKDWVQLSDGTIEWRDDVTSENHEKQLKKGEMCMGVSFTRYRAHNDNWNKGVVKETYGENGYKHLENEGMEEINVRALLSTIRETEGHGSPLEYNSQYGNNTFNNNYKDHPKEKITKWGNTSTAAGAYQFLGSTWDNVSAQLGLGDFSPANQDKGVVYLLQSKKAIYKQVKSGNVSTGLTGYNGVWTSLPGGKQQYKPLVDIVKTYNNYVNLELNNKSIIASPLGTLLKK